MSDMQRKKSIMTHIVLGYPDFDANRELIRAMADAGVAFIEMQIPFSDPVADGPTILNANQHSLNNRTSVKDCFDFAAEMAESYKNINFLFMTYYNIIFNFSVEDFVTKSKKANLYGLIVPDIPFEEDRENLFPACKKLDLNPIYVFSPTTSDERLKKIRKIASGFAYCTSRIGITGAGKNPHKKLEQYVLKAKKILDMPIAVGFGIDGAEKAKMIAQFADIVIIGSKVLNIVDEAIKAGKDFQKNVYEFLSGVREAIN